MEDNLYIVTCIDSQTQEPTEYEESSLEHALEIYNTLKNDADITSLNILQYNLIEQKYYIVDTTEF